MTDRQSDEPMASSTELKTQCIYALVDWKKFLWVWAQGDPKDPMV